MIITLTKAMKISSDISSASDISTTNEGRLHAEAVLDYILMGIFLFYFIASTASFASFAILNAVSGPSEFVSS